MIKFKHIPNFENFIIFSDGRIYSLRFKKFKKATKTKQGYLRVGLKNNGIRKNFLVHRLVAENFIPNPENKQTVNHIDGNKENNDVSNLEWNTMKENNQHAAKYIITKTNNKKVYCKENNKIYSSIREAAKDLNLNEKKLYANLKKNKKLKNYTFMEVK